MKDGPSSWHNTTVGAIDGAIDGAVDGALGGQAGRESGVNSPKNYSGNLRVHRADTTFLI